ncbi:secondary thiamine-phosphate synthase enzyme [Aciduliprofundum sp. MAR08-339]|uniref:secondary thiamine-phosphate synthase enzyme YjbQ n=1 Tax=Aciduliprofundum sp. (strain MAR08-339) TaxID=673860 RepID=UPI0002A49A90|nr:secondary thiamine-phosphate synthase enzyme [Aciduliprofundum sp. MAR08-339]
MNYYEEIGLTTAGEVDIIDITPMVQSIVDRSGIRNGMALVFVIGSTGAVTTIEYEPGLKKDLPAALERLFPKSIPYEHEKTWHDGNGHSHIRASFLKPDLCVPIVDGTLVLGTWQQIVFVELDVKERKRRVAVQVMGD